MRKLFAISASVIALAFLMTAVGTCQNVSRGGDIARQKCDNCHTLRDAKNQPTVGLFAGGKILNGAASFNLTPDASGISYYDEKLFLQVLRTGKVGARKLNPFMSPALFKDYSDEQLKDVFAYLRTIPAVKHRIDNTEPPTNCRVCLQKHGGGDSN